MEWIFAILGEIGCYDVHGLLCFVQLTFTSEFEESVDLLKSWEFYWVWLYASLVANHWEIFEHCFPSILFFLLEFSRPCIHPQGIYSHLDYCSNKYLKRQAHRCRYQNGVELHMYRFIICFFHQKHGISNHKVWHKCWKFHHYLLNTFCSSKFH